MKTKFSMHKKLEQAHLNLEEVGHDLATEANFYVTAGDDLPDVTGPELAMTIDRMVSTDTINFFLEQGDYGRGFLAGLGIGVFALELSIDVKLKELEEAAGGDEEDVSDEDIEDAVYGGIKRGLRGGGPEDGEAVN